MADNATLPPMAKISLIGIWIETVLYGINCIMYGLCMFILLRGKIATIRWVLVVMSTILFLLCTAHVAASLRQLLEAFVYVPAGALNYAALYWSNLTTTLRLLKDNLFATLVLVQDAVQIWRLYVVFMCDWKVVILPAMLTAVCVGSAYATSIMIIPANDGLSSSLLHSLVIAAWTSGFCLNVSVTAAIAGRLWWIGRSLASLPDFPTNRYSSSIYLIIESGAIAAVASIVFFALLVSNNPLSLPALDVISQLVALMPLLIVVQVGLTAQQHTPTSALSNSFLIAKDEMTFRARTCRERDSQQDLYPQTPLSRSPNPAHGTHI